MDTKTPDKNKQTLKEGLNKGRATLWRVLTGLLGFGLRDSGKWGGDVPNVRVKAVPKEKEPATQSQSDNQPPANP